MHGGRCPPFLHAQTVRKAARTLARAIITYGQAHSTVWLIAEAVPGQFANQPVINSFVFPQTFIASDLNYSNAFHYFAWCSTPLNLYSSSSQCCSGPAAAGTPMVSLPSPPRPSPPSYQRCFLSLGRLESDWAETPALTCSDCQQSCSNTTACDYYVWSSTLNCMCGGSNCPRSVISPPAYITQCILLPISSPYLVILNFDSKLPPVCVHAGAHPICTTAMPHAMHRPFSAPSSRLR